MTIGDALVDWHFWLGLFLVGTPMLAVEIFVFRCAQSIFDRIEGWLSRKVRR